MDNENIVNRLRVSDMLRINNLTDNEVRSDIISALEEIPFIYNLCKADRKRVHELKRWDNPYSNNRNLDPNGRIAVDLTNPHVLEDMDYFRQPAIHFKKHGRYTDYVKNNHPRSRYMIHWKEEQRRCREGYVREYDGEWITGYNYWYLNYCPIMITDTKTAEFLTATEDLYELHTTFESVEVFSDTITVERIEDFPKVWDSDYLWFHYVEQAEKKGKHCTNVKSRGKGYSFKGASMSGRNYYHFKKSKTFIIASEGDYLIGDAILDKTWDVLSFIDTHTPWVKARDIKNTTDHKKASYIDPKTKIEQGIKSEIIGVTTKNQPEKARGKRGKLLLFEEAGKFPHLIKAHTIARPSVEQGRYVFGTIISWGTGGTEGADFDGLRSLFTDPSAHNILGIPNVYDRKVYGKKECGFYCGEYMNREGLTDENGNSDVIAALIEIFISRRELSRSTNDPNVLIQERAERSITPDEAMMRKEGHIFNVEDLKHQLSEVQLHPKKYADSFWKVNLYMKDGSVYYRNSTIPPVKQYPIKENKGLTGCIEIFEHPVSENPQRGLYIAGTDPYDDDTSLGPSLGCTFVMNLLTGRIVAEYTGRPNTAEDFYENTLRMLMYYNAVCNYENNKKGMFGYFDKMKSLHYLADTPKILKDMQVLKSTGRGNTLKGTNATGGVNKYGNSLIRSYLVEPAYNKEGERNWQHVPSEGLLKELIAFNPNEGNYDRVAAFRMLMILKAEYNRYEIDDDIEDRESKPAIDPFFLKARPSLANRFSGIEIKDRTNDKRLVRR
jgi:hypothetical protein